MSGIRFYSSDGKEVKRNTSVDHLPKVEGYNFEEKFDFDAFIEAYKTTGFQATHFGKAVDIFKKMIEKKAFIFLSFTSNMISSGLREIITFLVKHKIVHVIVTSAGGVEEDVIKSLNPFVLGRFDVKGKVLLDAGICRTGNLYVPLDRYAYFEKFMRKFLDKIYDEQKKTGKVMSYHELLRRLGAEINSEDSYLYWAAKNDIPVFCPGLIDGAFGDMLHFYKTAHPDFLLEQISDFSKIVDVALQHETTGAVILGGGIAKHFTLNANIFKDGLDYAIYINTAQEYDGCDSGARIEEAITWLKIKPDAPAVKIHADATLIFPLLVAALFARKDKQD